MIFFWPPPVRPLVAYLLRRIYKNPMTTNPDKIHTVRPKAFFSAIILFFLSYFTFKTSTSKENEILRTGVRHQTCLFKLVIYMRPICQSVLCAGFFLYIFTFVEEGSSVSRENEKMYTRVNLSMSTDCPKIHSQSWTWLCMYSKI